MMVQCRITLLMLFVTSLSAWSPAQPRTPEALELQNVSRPGRAFFAISATSRDEVWCFRRYS